MAASLVSVNAGVATVYSSGDLSALAGVSALSSIIVTKNSNTPAGDDVVVDLSSGLAGVSALSSITVQNGATAKVGGGLLDAGVGTSLTVNGGILDLQGSVIGVTALKGVTVGPAGGEIKIEPTGLSVGVLNLPVTFVDANGNTTTTIPKNFVMDFPSSSSIPATYDSLTNTTTIGDGISLLGVVGAGRTITLSGDPFDLKATGSHFPFTTYYSKSFTQSDGSGGVITCYLAGSMIQTPDGEKAVETLQSGDLVTTYRDGQETVAPLVWTGKARVTVDANLPDDVAGYPVRIIKNALADGVPSCDLLVTAEHCLFLNGAFTPVRMLVNGKSIFYDHSITSYDYFHVETETHTIIKANGVLTETYLDTGNRYSFRQGGTVIHLGSKSLSWDTDAAAPLSVSQESVQPLFRQISDRLPLLGFSKSAHQQNLVQDPDFHLVTNTGVVIHKTREVGGRIMFMIPASVKSVHLVSRASSPHETIGPFMDDRRKLGICVGDITFYDSGRSICLTALNDEHAQNGWYGREAGGRRWTNGNALLVLNNRQPNSLGMLAIEVVAGGPYLADSKQEADLVTLSA
ncbi:Hint domain-containing protein [Gluconobacter japonicus]|uniref:Hint domain-containing protein n=1 Tax=Gluconobacter japonicus TaxID=376620 RepID=UPI0024ADAE38|nr:Hint domain-containing protein [Gluconobacter japonicus]MDI6653273.1 Hint domain-containing protein [Gluconobacter japonicus]